jgi:glycerophosphoryl diester phosphodiesterase
VSSLRQADSITSLNRSFVCIGHGGAPLLAPENTMPSFWAARSAGADMVEFDVLRFRGRVVLAHSFIDAARRRCVPLEDALTEFASVRFDGVRFNVDIKWPGCERELVDAVRRHGLLDRCLFSALLPRILDRVRELDPDARVGLSLGGRLARILCHRPRRSLRVWTSHALANGRFHALMVHHEWLTAGWMEHLRELEAEVYAWTVNEWAVAESLLLLGVAGVTTDDPVALIAGSRIAAAVGA